MTHQEKVKKVMTKFQCNEFTAVDIVAMLDWMVDCEADLKVLYDLFKADTGSDIPFNKFCYRLWPDCKIKYLTRKINENVH